ncbi:MULTISPECIES: hydroxyacid dehydrogenase [unclassified Novosphingobium]|uniref:hydroxyacid dehydrogenase n=1 Tax=unclassified Novosphingobium TaxID=2644732 RepID=UPI001357315C|nr:MULTISPECIES: hydroxyacid dehydrogenase [unclassified Novosphingobium]
MTTQAPLVFIVDPIHSVGAERLGAAYQVITPEQGFADPRLEDVTHIVVRTTELPEGLLARMPHLRAIVKHGAGVDNIPIPYATSRGMLVCNTPGGNNSTAVAEGAVALMLALLRQVREMDAVVREDRWGERWTTRLGDLTGANVGLIGFGRIARYTAKICGAGFGAQLAAYDPMVPEAEIEAAGAQPMQLDALLEWADVVSIHVPLLPGTRDLIGKTELSRMRPSAIIVNCSRGGIISEPALAEVLAAGTIAGAGIDVLVAEPPPADHPLFGQPNVILSPHVAGVTESGMKGMALACADTIDTIVAGERPANLLNPEILP